MSKLLHFATLTLYMYCFSGRLLFILHAQRLFSMRLPPSHRPLILNSQYDGGISMKHSLYNQYALTISEQMYRSTFQLENILYMSYTSIHFRTISILMPLTLLVPEPFIIHWKLNVFFLLLNFLHAVQSCFCNHQWHLFPKQPCISLVQMCLSCDCLPELQIQNLLCALRPATVYLYCSIWHHA